MLHDVQYRQNSTWLKLSEIRSLTAFIDVIPKKDQGNENKQTHIFIQIVFPDVLMLRFDDGQRSKGTRP